MCMSLHEYLCLSGNAEICGYIYLLHDEAIHQSKQPWVNLGQHVLGVSYHPAALVITLRG